MMLDEIADTVLEDRRDWFLARIGTVQSLAQMRLPMHRPPHDEKGLRKELSTLQKARVIMKSSGASEEVLRGLDREIDDRSRQLNGVTWTPTEAKQYAADEVLEALAIARGVHLGRLHPGRSPEDVPLTQDAAILHALLHEWGLHEAPDTTFKRVRKAVASARDDADHEERTGEAVSLRPLPQTVQGTDHVIF